METLKCDLLVIGGGGAGAIAALKAAGNGASVILVDKGVFGSSGSTPMAYFSACASLNYEDAQDSVSLHFEDTVRKGQFLNDQDLTFRFVQEAPERIMELSSMGVPFDKKEGRLCQALMPGHRFPRACYSDHQTGRAIIKVLKSHVLKHPSIRIFNDTLIYRLFSRRGTGVVGALGMALSDSSWKLFEAKGTILATGGGGQLYRPTTMARENTGDGISLALDAGASVMDLEFIQFFPLTLLYPQFPGIHPCLPGLLRRSGPVRIFGRDGKEFIEETIPEWRQWATRDRLGQMIDEEVKRGNGSERGGVWMDSRQIMPPQRNPHLSRVYQKFLRRGFDLSKQFIEVGPVVHFFMGGIRIDSGGRTSAEGLYAAGEASAGVHGANRLAGNGLTEMLVTGANAGVTAALEGRRRPLERISEDEPEVLSAKQKVQNWLERKKGVHPVQMKRSIQKIMAAHVGVTRERTGLEKAAADLKDLEEHMYGEMIIPARNHVYNKGLVDGLEASMMMSTATAIVRCALAREESRGAHFRSDFPQRDDARWLKNTITEKEDNRVMVSFSPVLLKRCHPA
jgi:fumarate reductase (CoM/CoB) subunit A